MVFFNSQIIALLRFLRKRIESQCVLFSCLARNPKFWLILATDIVLIVTAYCLAYVIRFADVLQGSEIFNILPISNIISLQIFLLCVKIPVFYTVGLYRGMWRYTSFSDTLNILKGTLFSVVLVLVLLLFVNRLQGFSRSIFILDSLLTFLLITGHRVAIRYFYKNVEGSRQFFLRRAALQKKRLLLIGAGSGAEKVLREIQGSYSIPYHVVGLVDDDPGKTGLRLHGAPIVGLLADLAHHIERTRAEEILITLSTMPGQGMQRVVELCRNTGLPFKVLPGIHELIDGQVSIKSIRDISYADLLGREQVDLRQESINNFLTGKVILVTGAGGSIGSELCRQILRFSPRQLILYDAGEENLYSIEMELRHERNYPGLVSILGKIQDLSLLEMVFSNYKPSVVFHAAAYKHVPLVEKNPWQAINNNVFAAQLLIESAILHGVERFVLVSTDKAVRPTNVMGASKRLTELLMLAYTRENWDGDFCPARSRVLGGDNETKGQEIEHKTVFMAVRFGNVLGSSGSVVPLFERQIRAGGPVTVTHPEVTRYFMSIEEASQLILQAGAMGRGGEIFLLKMGEPVNIAQMARELITLAGREPDTEIPVHYIGLREGEKLFEELIIEGEGIVATDHDKIMVLRGNGTKKSAELNRIFQDLLEKSRAHDSRGIKQLLQQLIPEYQADYSVESIASQPAELNSLHAVSCKN